MGVANARGVYFHSSALGGCAIHRASSPPPNHTRLPTVSGFFIGGAYSPTSKTPTWGATNQQGRSLSRALSTWPLSLLRLRLQRGGATGRCSSRELGYLHYGGVSFLSVPIQRRPLGAQPTTRALSVKGALHLASLSTSTSRGEGNWPCSPGARLFFSKRGATQETLRCQRRPQGGATT